jgi:WD40 repeat protein
LETGISTATLRGHTKDVCTLQFDETKIVSGSKDGAIKVVHRSSSSQPSLF